MRSVSALVVSLMIRSLRASAMRAFLDLVFVGKPRIEALELRMVPEDVRFLFDLDAAGNAMLHEQGLSDRAHHLPPLGGKAAIARQLGGKWLDGFEHLAHLALVAGERQVLGQGIGDDEEARRRQVADAR